MPKKHGTALAVFIILNIKTVAQSFKLQGSG